MQPVPRRVSGPGEPRSTWPICPRQAPAGSGEVEVAEEDIDTAYYQDGEIDLGELIHEQLYLMLPMKPLCQDDCQGLCPMCGANRNTRPAPARRRGRIPGWPG